jgi:hypothetical protein
MKTRIAKAMLGKSEMAELMILVPVFQALDKSIGMRSSIEVVIDGGS